MNHGDAILAGAFDLGLAVKILLNYATPFIVANLGLLSRETEGEDGEQKNQKPKTNNRGATEGSKAHG